MHNAGLFDRSSPSEMLAVGEWRSTDEGRAGDSVPVLVLPISSNGEGKNDESEHVDLAAPKTDEYPSGTTLAFIVIALVLSVFLSSLDIVGEADPFQPFRRTF